MNWQGPRTRTLREYRTCTKFQFYALTCRLCGTSISNTGRLHCITSEEEAAFALFPATHLPPGRPWEEETDITPSAWGGSEEEVAQAFKNINVWGEEDDEDDEGFDLSDDFGEEEYVEEGVLVFSGGVLPYGHCVRLIQMFGFS